jgi:hypothetical protein
MGNAQLGEGQFSFDWQSDWAKGDHHNGTTQGWAHHGIVVTSQGEIMTFSEERPEVQVMNRDGELLRTFAVDLTEGHGMSLVIENGQEFLWIADNGSKSRRQDDGTYAPSPKPLRGAAAKFTLEGDEVFRLTMPDLEMYAEGDYCPTMVAVDEERFGGSGDIWVADCYGQMVVHRFDKAGTYLQTLDGTEGAGKYLHPHSIHIDRRSETPELYVADRRNKRIQVYSLDGTFLRSFGEDFLVSPSGFVAYGDNLLITELDSRIAVLGPDNKLVTYLGEYDPDMRKRPGWPNVVQDGASVRPPLAEGAFNTPHGIAADSDGNLYVTEWLIGGRLVRLTPHVLIS